MLSSNNTQYSSKINYTPLKLFQLRRMYRERAFRRNMMYASIFLVLAIISGYFFLPTSQEKPDLVYASSETVALSATPTDIVLPTWAETPQRGVSTIEAIVQKELEGTKGTYAFAIKNLKTGESYYFNEHKKFQTASLYKVWIMAVTFNQIKAGTLSMDEELSSDVVALNQKFQIATEDAELKEGFVKFTVRDALEQMITNSHNYASLLLSLRIKLSSVVKFLNQHNLQDSSIGQPPMTTASDMALFFEQLYNNEITDPEHTEEMIALLKRQNLNNVLPKYIPEGVSIAHKTGQLFTYSHDAGIFYMEQKGDYVIVGMSDSAAYQAAEDRIAQVSRAVYTYFTEK